jgi:hypothetical protein
VCGQALIDRDMLAAYQRRRIELDRERRRTLLGEVRREVGLANEARLVEITERARMEAVKSYELQIRGLERTNTDMRAQLDVYKRRLERLSPTELGSVHEAEVLAALRAAFPTDQIVAVSHGPAGRGDIVQEVRLPGAEARSAGVIVYECKNHLRWSNDFVRQALVSRDFHRAAHAVLVSSRLPAKHIGVAVVDGVVVVDRAALIIVIGLVRNGMEAAALAGFTTEDRSAKADALRSYLASDEFRTTFASIHSSLLAVQRDLAKERSAHDRLWTRRDQSYRRISSGLAGISHALGSITAAAPARAARQIPEPVRQTAEPTFASLLP